MFITAYGPWEWLLNILGVAALTMPWKRVYISEKYATHEGLIAHEKVHLEQIDRDGAIMFSIKYLYWLARFGYWKNPYEVEAYRRAPVVEEEHD